MSAESLIDELSSIHPKGFDLSLDRITGLLEQLGNPQDKLPPVIHVAGTNGKGSTIAFCRAILEAGGYMVHTHTSPHLVNWHERFRLGHSGGGKLVTDDTLENAVRRAADANAGKPITVFELLSAAMFLLFSEHEADYCLIEVGLGGRFDATNVVTDPLVSVITPIALDHQSYLGDTIGQIAFEKAGIIKPGRPVVVGPQEEDAREVLEKVADKNGAPSWFFGQDFDCYSAETGLVYQDETGLLDLPPPALRGQYQVLNAGTAIAALRKAGIALDDAAFSGGMKNAVWPGRFERLQPGSITERLGTADDVWIDGGHNPSAGKVLAQELASLRRSSPKPVVLICGMINTKDTGGYFSSLDPEAVTVLTAPVSTSDSSVPPEQLARSARMAGLEAEATRTFDLAIERAVELVRQHRRCRVLFCGSLYFAGEVLRQNGTPPS